MDCLHDELLVFQPALDQAIAVARLLSITDRRVKAIGTTLPFEQRPCRDRSFVRYLHLNDLDELDGFSPTQLLPTGSLSTQTLLQRFPAVGPGPVMMRRQVLRFYDKVWSLGIAAECGLSLPMTWLSPENIDRYPVFVKKRQEGSGKPCFVAYRANHLQRIRGQESCYLYQEYIPTPDTFGVAFVAEAGTIVAYHIHREALSFPKLGGSAALIEEYRDQELLRLTKRLVRASNYTGWGLAEFKYCPTRKTYVFMELNAKLWASCEFTMRNNPELARLILGVPVAAPRCQSMIFINRMLRRSFWPGVLECLKATGAVRVVYPDLWRDVLAGLFYR